MSATSNTKPAKDSESDSDREPESRSHSASEDASSTPRSKLAERLATVQVGVRAELEISRQVFNGIPAYVVRDPITFQTFRLSVDDYQVFVRIAPEEQLGKIFEQLCEEGRLDRDQEEHFYKFIVHLNQIGILTLPVSDGKALYERFRRRRASERKAKILGIMFLRVPLIQPDRLLDRTARWFRPLFTRTAFLVWLLGMLACCLVILARWDEFQSPLASMLTLGNLPVLWCLLVGLKVFHEFGHAYACKVFGGKVPEMGAMFIVGTPCAYVDASDSWGFPNPLHRIIVALGGMYFESICAMFAVVIWALTGPGIVHSAAQYSVLLSTAVTIGFNANPLMKYDGYYVLSDLVGMPNLRNDARRQLTNQLKRLFFGIRSESIAHTLWGRCLLSLFGLASSVYKVVVVVGISAMIAFKIPAMGIGFALFYVGQTLWQMVSKLIRYLGSAEIEPVRTRALTVTGLMAAAAVVGIVAIPLPGSVQSTGILIRDGDRVVHAGATGFLMPTSVEEGQVVSRNAVVCRLANFELSSSIARKDAEIEQLEIQLAQESLDDTRAAVATRQRLYQAIREREALRHDCDELAVRAPHGGILANVEDLKQPGRFVKKGEPLAKVVAGQWIVETLVTAEDLSDLVSGVGDSVTLIGAGAPDLRLQGTIRQVAAAGSEQIEYESLTHLAGGFIPVAGEEHQADRPYFKITIAIESSSTDRLRHGATFRVRFRSRRIGLGQYVWHRMLQMFNQLRVAGN